VKRAWGFHVAESAIQVACGGITLVEASAEPDSGQTSFADAFLELKHQHSTYAFVSARRDDFQVVHDRAIAPLEAALRVAIVRPADSHVTEGLVTRPRDEIGERSSVLLCQPIAMVSWRPVRQESRHHFEFLTAQSVDIYHQSLLTLHAGIVGRARWTEGGRPVQAEHDFGFATPRPSRIERRRGLEESEPGAGRRYRRIR
jgi:hypothetical protein